MSEKRNLPAMATAGSVGNRECLAGRSEHSPALIANQVQLWQCLKARMGDQLAGGNCASSSPAANDNDDMGAMARFLASEANSRCPQPTWGPAVEAWVAGHLRDLFPYLSSEDAKGWALGAVEPGLLTGD
jgi:hypothetical protein